MKQLLISLAMGAAFTMGLSAQAATADLDQYYRFPVSIGLYYQGLSPLSAYNTPYNIIDLGADVRIPIPALPVIQPFARLGFMRFDSIDSVFPDKWDHYHFYGVVGAAYASRFARNFEWGAELNFGASEAVFPNAVDSGAVGSPFLLFGGGGKIVLDPSYNFSIEFQPSLRYLLALSPLKSFDGFVLSLGITASYRFGEDPDSARAIIRALRFDHLAFGPAFAAMQSYYADNPLGNVTITNAERQPVTNLEIAFIQPGYMDGETTSFAAPTLAPGGSVEVPLKAVFNKQVFTTEGRTPLTGQIITKYRLAGRDVEQRETVSYVLYDKTAITWDSDLKVGAFITPQDSSLKSWTAAVSEAARASALPTLNQPMQVALQIYQSLSAIGIQYQEVQGKVEAVDSINLPRTTLRQRYGDCDDLTVLFCSLLETRSIATAFITVPGHIYAAFDTGIAAENYLDINPDRGMTIAVNGTLWIPIEVTLLDGKSDFLAAWQRGIELWTQFASERNFVKTSIAQATYAPVGLQEALIQPAPPAKDVVLKSVTAARERFAESVLKVFVAEAGKTKAKREYNRLGVAYARFGHYPEAIAALSQATKLDPGYISAQVNLSNIFYMQKDYKRAINGYASALKTLTAKTGNASSGLKTAVLMNLSQASSADGNTKAAQDYLAQAQESDPSGTKALSAPGAESGTGRAGNAAGSITLVDEEQ
jgi:tetratricopeptide (TPR) repeat protein